MSKEDLSAFIYVCWLAKRESITKLYINDKMTKMNMDGSITTERGNLLIIA